MRRSSVEVWNGETIETAIAVLRLIRMTHAAGEVELHSPAQECVQCHKPAEVLVAPEGMCGECWSQKAIAAWRVLQRRRVSQRGHGGRREMEGRRSLRS